MTIDPRNLIELADAALAADYTRVRRAANSIAKELAKIGETEAAQELRALVRRKGVPLRASGYIESLPVDAKSRLPLVEEHPWPSTPIFLNEAANFMFQDFVSDASHFEELSAKGLASRMCLVVSGPPGTGKTLLAGHIAAHLGKPCYVIRLESIISSFLGETAKNIRSMFDFVPSKGAVLFLDEMDAIAKLRDDRHELGELKRVVNTVIQGLDALDEDSIVVAATNHPHLLDPAIWRRFPYKIELGLPELAVREDLWRHFLCGDDEDGAEARLLAQISERLSGADIETISLAARRHSLLGKQNVDFAAVAFAVLRTAEGNTASPSRRSLSSEDKREMATTLRDRFGLNGADIARLLGVTRQAVYPYLKEGED